ncbi:MAG: hypothetical protein AABY27_06780 [Pseudomonadota bacterium]
MKQFEEIDKEVFRAKLKDLYFKFLLEQFVEKHKADRDSILEKINKIYDKALSLNLTKEQLHSLAISKYKFTFLDHDDTTTDDIIHGTVYGLIALCHGDRKLVQGFINSLSKDYFILIDPSELRINNKKLSNEEELDAKELCAAVASYAKECIKEFSDELSAGLENIVAESNNLVSEQNDEPVNKRSISFEEDIANKKMIFKETSKELSILDYVFNNFLSWIYELPECLQEHILNTEVVKKILEEKEIVEKLYNHQYFLKGFEELLAADKKEVIDETLSREEKVKVSLLLYEEMIDTELRLENNLIQGIILPMDSGGIINWY